MLRIIQAFFFAILAAVLAVPAQAQQSEKPNILVIWGDDIGVHNVSAYTHGIMGYRTPNIDRLAQEGALFTDAYAQQSCTAGRASFILGQNPFRTGLLTIGMPGSEHGIPDWAPTIADLLKEQGYTTGQFGKNHLGDRDKHLPTAHGFDEFYGNLYHLNAEEEPETYYYPKDPEFRKKYGPRGVIHSYANGEIIDTGPLTQKRMETVDQEIYAAAGDLPGQGRRSEEAVLRLVQHHPNARLDPPEQGVPGQDRHRPLSGRHGRARRHGRRAAEEARRPEDRRQHHRHLFDRQRRRDRVVAGRRHHAVLRREGDHLGRRLPRAPAGALAGRGEAGLRRSTTSSPRRTGCPPCWRPPASPTSRRSWRRATGPTARTGGSSSTATTSCRS